MLKLNVSNQHRHSACDVVGRNSKTTRLRAAAVTSDPVTLDATIDKLKAAARKPGCVPASEVVKAVVDVEKSKVKLPDNWPQLISAPDKRWRLIFTADSRQVQAAGKGLQSNGIYFPLTACQKFSSDNTFENGVFLGPLAHLTFKGPMSTNQKQLSFDVHTMYVGVGPWRLGIPLKKDGKPISELDPKAVKKLPFFLYAYIDDEIIVARGRSGGLALWVAADSKWQANAGVLQVYK
ncbi:hypothetical protein CEUSTIGMA_g1194.t1 [Chlamydomonas eustigma]|uniref:Plastid lipid-associated protein/fibrillin conserved domain-containing protein n=1 Tax=Chlamydomonas eustigma TaxID=1157962 RepID=A0A250WSI6_9CHLO|nr:hypothetical protein CEUSTIGMA_g1194.t1 [Chlamydomonas eustigma]|eukprot:GAX73741.1 hypothetical protein CEUSTIGMA_g1194.t1 [Chlamydomonas eustigma]